MNTDNIGVVVEPDTDYRIIFVVNCLGCDQEIFRSASLNCHEVADFMDDHDCPNA